MVKSLKRILWIVSTFILTYVVICSLLKFEKLFKPDGFLFAFELHFILMAWYAFSLPFLKLKYDSTYFNIKPFEKNGKLYSYFGVNIFRLFLKKIGWNKISDSSNGVIQKNLERLKKREKHTREAELAHVILFWHFILIAFCFLKNHNVFWLLFLNIVFHVFPVFVQRYNRPRYLKLISRFENLKTRE